MERTTIWDDIWAIVRETPMKCGGPHADGNGYRKDSIKELYIPEYTIERSGEKLFELIKWTQINFDWIKPYDDYYLIRSKRSFMTFIKYRIDSTWYRRIVSLIDSFHGDGIGDKFIIGLWLRDQLIISDVEMAATLIKLIAGWNDGKIRDGVLRDIVHIACAFRLDLDNCLQTVYGIDSSYIDGINRYIMKCRTDTNRKEWMYEWAESHGEWIEFPDGVKVKIYDMKHQILLF